MHVKRFQDAKPYEAPNHRGVVGLMLQGVEPGGPVRQTVSFSQYLPGGGAGPDRGAAFRVDSGDHFPRSSFIGPPVETKTKHIVMSIFHFNK